MLAEFVSLLARQPVPIPVFFAVLSLPLAVYFAVRRSRS